MALKQKKIAFLTLLIGLNACSTDFVTEDFLEESEQASADVRIINPEIAKSIEAAKTKENVGFPDLYEMPDTKPERLSDSSIMLYRAEIEVDRDRLAGQVAGDRLQAIEDRAELIRLIENGRFNVMTLTEAARTLLGKISEDQQSARRQTSQPMPKLGGLPPKEQR